MQNLQNLTNEEVSYLRELLESRKAYLAETYIGVYAEAGEKETLRIDGILEKF